MTNTYARAYTEVLEILKHFSKEEYSKIPIEKINFYKDNMDKDYIYEINPEIELSKQYISKEANAILVSLFREYFATEEQRKTLDNLLNQNQQKLEEIKREKYSVDNIFKNNNEEENKEKVETKEELALVEIKEEKWYKKILSFFTSILRKK